MNAKELRDFFYAGVAAAALGIAGGLLPTEAEAQNAPAAGATAVTQSAYHADAGSLLATVSATNCTATQAAVAQGTLGQTITPPAGWFVYLTGVFIDVASNGTGTTTSQTAWTTVSTGTTNLPSWLVSSPGATALGSPQQIAEVYPTGFKVNVAGASVVLAPQATLASTETCAKFLGYFSPL